MAKKVLNIDPDKIKLEFIEEISVAIDDIKNSTRNDSELSIHIAHLTGYILEGKKFLFGLKLVFSTNNQSKEFKCKFRFNFHFTVDNLQDMYILNDDKEPLFQEVFVATLAGISYSTLRGIVFEKTTNTKWGTLVLPVINPSELLKSWIEQE